MRRVVRAFGGGKRAYVKAIALAGLGLACATPAAAVKIDAGDYVPAPPGTKLGLLYLQYSASDALYANGQKIDDKARLDTKIGIARFVGFGTIAGMTFDYQVLQPFGQVIAGGSTSSLGHASGVGDTILVSTLWVHNDPDHASYFGITPYLWIPDGNYDRNQPLNIGEHRWKGAMQAVWSQGITKHFIAELSGDVTAYGRNNKALGGPLKQKVMTEIQGFARYVIDPADELNVRVSYTTGGRTSLADVAQNDRTNTWAVLGTFRRSLDKHHQIMLQGGTDLAVRNGFKEGMRFQVRLLQVF